MKLTREFLGWEQPFLQSVARRLIEMRCCEQSSDLRDVIVVLPGSRAARMLEELVAREAAQQDLSLFPPSYITPGALPEKIYQPVQEIASAIGEVLAWNAAIRSLDAADLRTLVNLSAKPNLEWKESLELAEHLAALWHELSAAGLSFKAVEQHCEERAGEREAQRWKVIDRLFENYLVNLSAQNLLDRAVAREQAIRSAGAFDKTIVLAGVVDLPKVHCDLMEACAEDVRALVFASDDQAHRFDRFGCLLTESWVGASLDTTDLKLRTVEDAAMLGGAVRAAIAEASTELARSEITIGVADDEILPFLGTQLAAADVAAHPGAGSSLAASELGELLRAVQGFVSGRSFGALAALVRVPAVDACLRACYSLPLPCSTLDLYYQRALPQTLDSKLSASPIAKDLVEAVTELCAGFEDSSPQTVHEWAGRLRAFLKRLYTHEHVEVDSSLKDSLTALLELSVEIEDSVSEKLELTAADFFSLLLSRCRSIALPETQVRDSIEMLSWLELALDTAPMVVVAGCNEPALPRAVSSDPFLPDSFRQALGLSCFNKRWARDAYLMQTMISSKPHLNVIALRRNGDGEALALSRLLLAIDSEAQARRLSDFYDKNLSSGDRRLFFASDSVASAYEPPLLEPVRARRLVMSVTSFKDYLVCPYRFYLKHVYKLRVSDDRALELDAAQFGTLIHSVLERFGKSEDAALREAEKIGAALEQLLNKEMLRRFGKRPQPAVLVQGRQALSRLWDFAHWQAERREAGWRITETELKFSESDNVVMQLESEAELVLTGTVDRVDVHEANGKIALIDYKTFAKPQTPEQVHQDRHGNWTDLQLPLYVELMRARGIDWPDQLGFVCLSAAKVPVEDMLRLAQWSRSEVDEAAQQARLIAEEILSGSIPEPELLSSKFDNFAAICGEGMLHDLSVQVEAAE